jgi:4-amino-4-deoxy-L-arabinose transferase-like glycosyltransferase
MRVLDFLKKYPWILPTIIFAVLVILGANMHPLWGDEAETALFAKNILKYGIPKGWDGTNIMGIENGIVLNQDLINHTSPWGQYYLTALSFLIFGVSAIAARIPFILLAVASIPLIYYLVIKLTDDKLTATLTCIILALSVPYILFAYQARYYSITNLASLFLFFSAINLTKESRWSKITFLASMVLFFYGNYEALFVFYISLFASIIIYFVIKKVGINKIKTFILWFIGLSLAAAIFTLPWYFIMQPGAGRASIGPFDLKYFFQALPQLYLFVISGFNHNNAFPVVAACLLPFVILLEIKFKKNLSSLILILAIPAIFIFIQVVLALVFLDSDINFLAPRYTMVIFPYFSILVAMITVAIFKYNKPLGGVFLIIYLATNFFTLEKPQSLMWNYLNEIAHPYPVPDKAVADYLMQNAKVGDTAYVNLDRDHEPLMFLLGDKIKFVNRIDYANPRVFPKNRYTLPLYTYFFLKDPDWIILYSKRGKDGTFYTMDDRSAYAPRADLKNDYQETVLPVFFSDLTRPEIEYHSFKEIKPGYNDQIFIYKKIKNG